ncbi:MAG: hypothetical protein JNG88_00640 [Phycisphaerales bacterium]|nr:hypothetical protein [Phycisphaerales bacterium]
MAQPSRRDSDTAPISLGRWVAPLLFVALAIITITIPIALLTIPRPGVELHTPHGVQSVNDEAASIDPNAIEDAVPSERMFDDEEGAVSSGDAASAPRAEPVTAESYSVPVTTESMPPLSINAVPAEPPHPADSHTGRLHRSPEERRKRIEQFGGSRNTENAVEAGVLWLATHQSPDGTWDRFNFDRQCPADDRCSQPAISRETDSLQTGVTGLALLAILGAGYSDIDGPYQENVRRATKALLKLQRADGGFSPTDGQAGYNNSVATLALAELYALNGDRALVDPINRAVARLVASQQPLGGWDYSPLPTSGRNDTSITAWALQALLAARSAGIDVPSDALARAAVHFSLASESDGRVKYADAGTGFAMDNAGRPQYRYGGPMTAIGLMSAQLLGWRNDLPLLERQAGLLLADPPSMAKARGGDPSQFHCEYYWYYGTIALFQRGGEPWEQWNAALRDAILPAQERPRTADGRRKHTFGSWPAYGHRWGKWARPAGRVYSTAICVLTLEVYYRHTPAYLEDGLPLNAADWRNTLLYGDDRLRLAAISALRGSRFEIGEPVLVDQLSDRSPEVAVAAAIALTEIDSLVGRETLERAFSQSIGSQRGAIQQALHRCEQIGRLPAVEGRVRLVDSAQGLVTLELPRAYAGMRVSVWRGGAPAVPLRVVQRFSGRNVVVAEVSPDFDGAEPRAGEMVRSE